jgi:hypothetical protein
LRCCHKRIEAGQFLRKVVDKRQIKAVNVEHGKLTGALLFLAQAI